MAIWGRLIYPSHGAVISLLGGAMGGKHFYQEGYGLYSGIWWTGGLLGSTEAWIDWGRVDIGISTYTSKKSEIILPSSL